MQPRVTKRRWLGVVGLVLFGALAFLWVDRCGAWPSGPPQLSGLARGSGRLLAGSAQVPVRLSEPVTVGGYGPLRSSTSTGDEVFARATVVDVGGTRVGVVSLEVLLVTTPMVAAIRTGFDFPLVVTATHTHSSIGQFDRRLAAQVGALGSFDEAVERALVAAAREALTQARQQLTPSTIAVREFDTASFVRARSGSVADTRGLEIAFSTVDATSPHSRWLLLAAHPTLAARGGSTLDTDWPGAVSASATSQPLVTLVLQTAVGNASVDKEHAPTEVDVAKALEHALAGSTLRPGCDAQVLDFASAHFAVPHPDGSRLAPGPFARLAENALCASSEMESEVTLLRLGCVTLLAVPVEPTAESARLLEQLTGATRVLALSNGYLGYLEPADVIDRGSGEARRQWFGPELFDRVGKASLLTAMEAQRR